MSYLFSSLLQFKSIAGHIHQGNLDSKVLSYSLFINLSVFEESYHVYLQPLLPQTKCHFIESCIINHVSTKADVFFTSFFFLFSLHLSFLVFSLTDTLPIFTPLPQSDSVLNYFLHLFHDFVTGLVLEFGFLLIMLYFPAFAKNDLKVLKHSLPAWLKEKRGLRATLSFRIC